MGDLFHSTSANQSSQNQQIGTSNRDVTGQQVIGGAGSVTAGSGVALAQGSNLNLRVTNTSLDPLALSAAAATVNHAIDANLETTHSALQSFQNSTAANAETPQQATTLTPDSAYGAPGNPGGINPSQILWIGIAVIGVVLLMGMNKK